MSETKHKAGFVSIIGKPNVGKSTLMNQLLGERLSIVTSKAQTTRHRIMGILSGENYQIVYSDTPGVIKPQYALHESMMRYVKSSLEDADVILFVTDINEQHDEGDVIDLLNSMTAPIVLIINKIDLSNQAQVEEKIAFWKDKVNASVTVALSALHAFNTQGLLETILNLLPEHPAYFGKDELTDRPERFFAAEIIREKIFLNYQKEVPYSCEVNIEYFKEDNEIIRIGSVIVVERDSQKGIIIGKGGEALKKVGSEARKDMESFFQKKVFLEQFVKVEPDWRKRKVKLSEFGYDR